jgi:predicted DNA-binding transcriptional regulator YafY
VVEETPLSPQQKMTPQKDGRVLVEARVPDTRVLHAWILGFGGAVEVKRPAALRKSIADAHSKALARYAARRA